MSEDIVYSYKILPARLSDIPLLAAIELAAVEMFRGYAPDSVLHEVTSRDDLQEAQLGGHLWVALASDAPVGFAHVKLIEPNFAHLEELDVHPAHGRRGIGTRLVNEVLKWTRQHRFRAVTLTTFRHVPWNMPFYKRLGFDEVPANDVTPTLRLVLKDEERRGLDLSQRVVMKWIVPASDEV